jgi:hypothetical protein
VILRDIITSIKKFSVEIAGYMSERFLVKMAEQYRKPTAGPPFILAPHCNKYYTQISYSVTHSYKHAETSY